MVKYDIIEEQAKRGVGNNMILYSNNCPKCMILKSKLDNNNIEYRTSNDFKPLIESGFRSAPVLELDDGRRLLFDEAMRYLN